MPGPNSPQSFAEARKEFKKQRQKQKQSRKKRPKTRHARRKLSLSSAKAIKKKHKTNKTKKTKKTKGNASKPIRCDCGDKSYTGSELTPRGLGHCEECTLEKIHRERAVIWDKNHRLE